MELKEYIKIFRLCPVRALNILQEWGVVSDNCVEISDVSPADQDVAQRFIRLNQNDLKLVE